MREESCAESLPACAPCVRVLSLTSHMSKIVSQNNSFYVMYFHASLSLFRSYILLSIIIERWLCLYSRRCALIASVAVVVISKVTSERSTPIIPTAPTFSTDPSNHPVL